MKNPTVGFNPLAYPKGTVSQFFGENPVMYQRIGLFAHNGIDIVAEWDSPLFAVESGTVVNVKREPEGYGRHIRILGRERNGVCNEWTYGHCEQLFVTPGQKVKAGDVIGTMGNTGFVVSTSYANTFWGASPDKPSHPGTHLHLGLRKAVLDPKGFKYAAGPKIRILNYDNGYKGGIDPMPELSSMDSTEGKQRETIAILERVVELYKQLLSMKK